MAKLILNFFIYIAYIAISIMAVSDKPIVLKSAKLVAIAIMKGEITVQKTILQISGIVRFTQSPVTTIVEIDIRGLPTGQGIKQHGIHVHELGITNPTNIVADRCNSAGPHFNPFNVTHGGLNTLVRHIGDLGNVESNNEGVIKVTLESKSLTLRGPLSIVGRTIVLHENRDDLGLGLNQASKENGNSGARIACGVIGIDKSKLK